MLVGLSTVQMIYVPASTWGGGGKEERNILGEIYTELVNWVYFNTFEIIFGQTWGKKIFGGKCSPRFPVAPSLCTCCIDYDCSVEWTPMEGTPWKWGTGMCGPEDHLFLLAGHKTPILAFSSFHDPTITPKSQIFRNRNRQSLKISKAVSFKASKLGQTSVHKPTFC